MGVEHLHALRTLPDTSVVALCDPHAASLATARSIVSNDTVRTYQNVEQLVAATMPTCVSPPRAPAPRDTAAW
ncbi:MAG: hypothetical protein ACKODN_10685 [Actinomycetota bacterium]